jgi:hypothetical protein
MPLDGSIRRLAHHVADASADDVPGVQAEVGGERLVDELVAAVGVAVGNEDRGVVRDQLQLPLPLVGRLLGPPHLGAVPHDLGEAPEPARLVLERRHRPARPEAAAVLPQVPAVILAPPAGEGLLQFLLRDASLHILRGEEAVALLADDLLLGEPQQSLGPLAPGEDVAVRVHDEEGVVLDVLGQQAKHLAFPGGVWWSSALGHAHPRLPKPNREGSARLPDQPPRGMRGRGRSPPNGLFYLTVRGRGSTAKKQTAGGKKVPAMQPLPSGTAGKRRKVAASPWRSQGSPSYNLPKGAAPKSCVSAPRVLS